MIHILLIDDDQSLIRVTEYQLKEDGFQVSVARDGKEGWKRFENEHPDLVISDINMPYLNGFELIQKIRKVDTHIPIIIMTAYGSLDNALQSTDSGADDYLTKPFSFQTLKFSIQKCLQLRDTSSENERLKRELYDKFAPENIIGQSEAMKNVMQTVAKLAASDSTVLIYGESGTGKELIARAIHSQSKRSRKPFIAVNCAAIPDNLVESELFGHAKGAFTGAVAETKGKFEAADQGTIFLDEIGDLNLDIQTKLLRVLQEREIGRVGESVVRKVDVRVIAATHRHLQEMVTAGTFRQDLFYRLNVIPLDLPPLRARKADIPLLAQHFVHKLEKERQFKFSAAALEQMVQYDWPGNIRELENLVERFSILNAGTEIQPDQLPWKSIDSSVRDGVLTLPFPEEGVSLEEIEKYVIQQALLKNRNNQTKTAHFLKMPRHTLIYRMKKFGLDI